jgi:hypothetical protein
MNRKDYNSKKSYSYKKWQENREEAEREHNIRGKIYAQKKKLLQIVTPQMNIGRSLKQNIESYPFYGHPARMEKLAQQYYPNMNLSDAIVKLLEQEPYVVEGVGVSKSTAEPLYNDGEVPIVKLHNLEEKEIIEDMKRYWRNVHIGIIKRNTDYEEYIKSELDYLINRNYNYTTEGGRRTRRAQRKTRKSRAQRKTRKSRAQRKTRSRRY